MTCPYEKLCGFCRIGGDYRALAEEKLAGVRKLLAPFVPVTEILTEDDPLRYRTKVTASFSLGKDKKLTSGHYEEGTRSVVPAKDCLLEDERAAALIRDLTELVRSFRFEPYDPKTGRGLLRHVQVRTSVRTGETMVTLVTGTPVFPSRQNFVKELRRRHPEITTVVQNVNARPGSMVLGDRFQTLFGPGFIEDELLGLRFRLSPSAFYQVNGRMTGRLYETAIGFAGLTGTETVIDAYCGTGTIGLCAAGRAGEVIGVELNPDSVRDAQTNARRNKIENARFLCADAGDFLQELALSGGKADVLFLDPPRSGSSPDFLAAAIRLRPSRIVYVSCGPDTLARDLRILTDGGFRAEKAVCVEMFPFTEHVETVVRLVS